jgi:hypothetical protein
MRNRKISPPALKHGAFSGSALLPGEDPKAFKNLHDDLIAELLPVGPMEDDIVAKIARLIWRKQNLGTYRVAQIARDRASAIYSKYRPEPRPCFEPLPLLYDEEERSPEQIRADEEAADKEVKRELGDAIVFVEMGKEVTISKPFEDLDAEDRIDGIIYRCFKRLLLVRGAKSISQSTLASSATPPKRLTAVTYSS